MQNLIIFRPVNTEKPPIFTEEGKPNLYVKNTSKFPRVYEPTMSQLKDFPNYFGNIEARDKDDKIGAVKIKMSDEYIARNSEYDFNLENALKQENVAKTSVKMYKRLANSKTNLPLDSADIEKSYLEDLNCG